jgi:hypothetical protein
VDWNEDENTEPDFDPDPVVEWDGLPEELRARIDEELHASRTVAAMKVLHDATGVGVIAARRMTVRRAAQLRSVD